jgi:hypothetical protein
VLGHGGTAPTCAGDQAEGVGQIVSSLAFEPAFAPRYGSRALGSTFLSSACRCASSPDRRRRSRRYVRGLPSAGGPIARRCPVSRVRWATMHDLSSGVAVGVACDNLTRIGFSRRRRRSPVGENQPTAYALVATKHRPPGPTGKIKHVYNLRVEDWRECVRSPRFSTSTAPPGGGSARSGHFASAGRIWAFRGVRRAYDLTERSAMTPLGRFGETRAG